MPDVVNLYPVLAGAFPVAPRDAVPGTGPSIPIVKAFTTPGTFDLLTSGIPLNATLTITLNGGGGGGGKGTNGPTLAGGGGGSGAGVIVVVEPSVWNTGASITVGDGAEPGDTTGAPGDSGGDSALTLTAAMVTAGGGGGGGGSTHAAGTAGQVSTTGSGFTIVRSAPGVAGQAGVSASPARGGGSIYLGKGAGGVGDWNNPTPGNLGGVAVQFSVG